MQEIVALVTIILITIVGVIYFSVKDKMEEKQEQKREKHNIGVNS